MTYPYKSKKKIDVHTHSTLSPSTYKHLSHFSTTYRDLVLVRDHPDLPCCAQMIKGDGSPQRTIQKNAYDAETRIHDCDQHGVTQQVISTTPMMIPDSIMDAKNATYICRILNDDIAAMVDKFPKRFIGLGVLPMMHADEAIKEMERIKKLGLKGIEINSNINGLDLGNPRFFSIFEAAEKMGMAVLIHPWGGLMSPKEPALQARMNEKEGWRPWLVGMPLETALAFESMRRHGVHERLPNLPVLYVHGGGAFPALLGRMEHGAYCRPDLFEGASTLNPRATIIKCGVYTDSLTHDPLMLEVLVRRMGAHRIALGSDYPFPLGEMEPFYAETKRDMLGNVCPYREVKGIYPGQMIEHLPGPRTSMARVRKHFNWLPEDEYLPRLMDEQKEMMLFGTAEIWLGLNSAPSIN